MNNEFFIEDAVYDRLKGILPPSKSLVVFFPLKITVRIKNLLNRGNTEKDRSFALTFCPLLLLSVHRSYFLSIALTFCQLLLLSVHCSYFLSFALTFCPLLLLSVLCSYSLSIALTFCPLLLLSFLCSYFLSFALTFCRLLLLFLH